MNQAQLHDHLERTGFWRPFEDIDAKAEPEPQPKPPKGLSAKQTAELDRRRFLQRDGNRCIRKFQKEFKSGKRAFVNRAKRTSNPYECQSIGWELWFEGFDAGQQEKIERKKR